MITVWFIEDDRDLLELYKDTIKDEEIKGLKFNFVLHWDQCLPDKYDVVFTDLSGVGNRPCYIEDVLIYTLSGSTNSETDFSKPFGFVNVIDFIRKMVVKND